MERLLVENILKRPLAFEWSVQGLGMLRMYLSPAVRLHIWDRALRIPEVSALHTHPWDFESHVVAGIMRNTRYCEGSGEGWNKVFIKCGEEAHTMGVPEKVLLMEQVGEKYGPGARYHQSADEIHFSHPDDGTVTIVERTFRADTEHAYVYWRGKGGWVDAKPRPATPDEVRVVTARALNLWF